MEKSETLQSPGIAAFFKRRQLFFLLFSVSALPAIVAENIDDGRFEWLSWVSAGLYVIEMVFAYRYEKKNKLK